MVSSHWWTLLWFTVPITVIASTKKVKSLVSNINMLTQAIRSSSKLVSIFDTMRHYFCSFSVCSLTMQFLKVLSVDGKKVKRKHPYTEREKEDLQVKRLYGFFFFFFFLFLSTWIVLKFVLIVSIMHVIFYSLAVSHRCGREFTWRSFPSESSKNIWYGWEVNFFYPKPFVY